MSQRKSTDVEMVIELLKMHPYPEVQQMVVEAKAGEYHDFRNVKYICGKVASADHLHKISVLYPDCEDQALKIRADIIKGVYDETMNEEDKKNMAKDLPEGMKKMLGLEDY